MENKNILLLRHHPMNVHFTNTFYTSQTENDLDEYMIFDVTSRVTRNKEFMEQHPRFARDLSPFYAGTVKSADGVEAKIFEIKKKLLTWRINKAFYIPAMSLVSKIITIITIILFPSLKGAVEKR